jgi:hypothetical protein
MQAHRYVLQGRVQLTPAEFNHRRHAKSSKLPA